MIAKLFGRYKPLLSCLLPLRWGKPEHKIATHQQSPIKFFELFFEDVLSKAGFMGPQICRSAQISRERSLPLGEWRASEVDIASEISSEIFQQFQWIQPDFSSIRELTSETLAKKFLS